MQQMKPVKFLSLALLAASLCSMAAAQLAPSTDAPPVSNAPAAPEEEKPIATLSVNVNLVTLFFTVKDKNGMLVPHLTREDCTITDEKVPQEIKTFSAETNLPLTLGILIDTSGSQQRVLPLEQDAGSRFIERVIKSKDQAFVLSFDVNIDLLQDFTNSTHLLTRALNKAEINTAGGNGAGGIPGLGGGTVPTVGDPKGTLLYDAVYEASYEKMSTQTGRKALIVLTDGQDQGSRRKIGEAIEAAQKANVIVYVILVADRGFYYGQGEWYTGHSAMKKLTEETGGRLIDVGNNGPKLQAAFEQIEEELRTQYLASYKPKDSALDGKFHHVSVECRGDGLKVQVRKGYYAIATEHDQ